MYLLAGRFTLRGVPLSCHRLSLIQSTFGFTMPNAIEAQIKNRITEFVQELDILVRKSTLEALHGVLANGPAPARRGRPGVRRGPGRPRGSTLVEGVADAIVSHVRANDGQTVGEIVNAVGAAPKAAKKAIKDLLASGALRKTGAKRGTRYHVGSGKPARAKRAKRAKGRGGKRKAA